MSIRRLAERLPDLEARWNEAPPVGCEDDRLADQVSFRDEWRDDMDRLAEFRDLYVQGALTGEPAEQYRGLIPLLRSMLPTMKRLGLMPHPASVFETPAANRGPEASTLAG